jgi:hypothetical protein
MQFNPFRLCHLPRRSRLAILFFSAFLISFTAEASHRSHSVTAAFKRAHPCPATGERRGVCPGYIIDHVIPLCAGGPDTTANLQWQTVAEAKAKDREERRLCRRK